MDKHQGAVVGAGLLSFFPGLSAQQRDSVKWAALIAERETFDAHHNKLIDDWYSYYKRKLMFYGWDAVPPGEVHWPSDERPVIVDNALRMISATAGSEFATSIGLAMQGLKRNGPALLHFEQRAQEGGVFQLLPCAPAKNGYVDMVLYHESIVAADIKAGFLFRERRQRVVKAELVRFNTRLFDQQFRRKVERSLETVALREIRDLQI